MIDYDNNEYFPGELLDDMMSIIARALKATGKTSFAGTFFDCTISDSERANFDVKSLRADLGEDACAPYVKAPTPVVTLKLVAKK